MYFIFIATRSILQLVQARVHISSRVKVVGLAMGKENPTAHVTDSQPPTVSVQQVILDISVSTSPKEGSRTASIKGK